MEKSKSTVLTNPETQKSAKEATGVEIDLDVGEISRGERCRR